MNQNQINQNQMSQLLGRMNPTTIGSHHVPNTIGQMTSGQMTNQMIGSPAAANVVTASQPQMNPNIIGNQSLGGTMNQPNVVQSQMNAPGKLFSQSTLKSYQLPLSYSYNRANELKSNDEYATHDKKSITKYDVSS